MFVTFKCRTNVVSNGGLGIFIGRSHPHQKMNLLSTTRKNCYEFCRTEWILWLGARIVQQRKRKLKVSCSSFLYTVPIAVIVNLFCVLISTGAKVVRRTVGSWREAPLPSKRRRHSIAQYVDTGRTHHLMQDVRIASGSSPNKVSTGGTLMSSLAFT